MSNWTGKVDVVITSPPYLDVTKFSEDQWQTLQGDTAVGAYAQVVLTATTVDGVSRVTFVLDGAIIGAPTPGAGTKDVVTRRDYRTLDPDR